MDKKDLDLSRLIVRKFYTELFSKRAPWGICSNWSEKRASALDQILFEFLEEREYQAIVSRFGLKDLNMKPWKIVGLELYISERSAKTSGCRAMARLRSRQEILERIKLVCEYSETEAEVYATNLFMELLDLYGGFIAGGRYLRTCQIKKDLKLFLSIDYDYVCREQMKLLVDDSTSLSGSPTLKTNLLKNSIKALKTDAGSYSAFYELIDREMQEKMSRL